MFRQFLTNLLATSYILREFVAFQITGPVFLHLQSRALSVLKSILKDVRCTNKDTVDIDYNIYCTYRSEHKDFNTWQKSDSQSKWFIRSVNKNLKK